MAATSKPSTRRKTTRQPAPTSDVRTEDFVFERDGVEYRLPSFAMLKSGLIRSIRNLDEADAFYVVLEDAADADTLAAIDDMPMVELAKLIRDWQAHAGVTLGESRRSSS